MRLLSLEVEGDRLFKESLFSMDFYASDRVVKKDGIAPRGVTSVGNSGTVYSENVIGISGVNASGKTTSLSLIEFVARYLTMPYVMRSEKSLTGSMPAKLNKNFSLRVIFWHANNYYALNAELEVDGDSDSHGWYRIVDEYLYRYRGDHPTKKSLSNYSEFVRHSELIIHRNAQKNEPGALSKDQKTFLRDDMSVTAAITGSRIVRSYTVSGKLAERTYDTPLVNAFDNSIEYLRWDSSSETYLMKFYGEDERSVSRNAAEDQLSTGTILGSELVMRAISVLKSGGLMIVDEIEWGLNKSLVKTIMELFLSSKTNPNGAQLIFTTHYPEILDFLPRKDDVYLLVRDASYATTVVKYSDRVPRIENKKSEVVLSNFIKGTVPDYPDIRDLRQYVRSQVEAETND